MTDSLTYSDLAFPVFCNTRVVGSVGGTPLTVEDAIRAALVTRSNVFLVGTRGTGKTQAATDIVVNFFGDKGLRAEGRPDFKLDDYFTRVNLDKLRTAGSTDEIIELARHVTDRVFFVDELDRCPAITQNQFINLAIGYYLHKGKKVPLGNAGYSIAFATANVGNGEFTGTFQMDSALLDRWQLVLDLDYWRKTPEDEERIAQQKRDPRIKEAATRDISDKIIAAYEGIGQPSEGMELISRYLTQGLDYCKKFPTAENSKRVLAHRFPVICHEQTCDLRETACGIARPLEERAAQTILRLAQGLEYIARLKRPETKSDDVNSMLLAYSLVAPHTRVLSQHYVNAEENFGNPALAGRHAAEKLRADIAALQAETSPVLQAYAKAKHGKDRTGIDALPAQYEYLKPFLQRVCQ
jgi:hypothetical protein